MDQLRFTQLLTLPWLVSEATVFLRDRQRGAGILADGGSRPLIIVAMTAAVWVAFGARARNLAPMPGPEEMWMAGGGILMIAGIVLRQRAVRFLGRYFRTRVTMLDDHQLITAGPYARVRHPSYTGGLISAAAIGVALGSAVSLVAMLVLPAAAFAYRIKVEERALGQRFGIAWQDYRAATSALVPGVW